jgi:hypothetical protein
MTGGCTSTLSKAINLPLKSGLLLLSYGIEKEFIVYQNQLLSKKYYAGYMKEY